MNPEIVDSVIEGACKKLWYGIYFENHGPWEDAKPKVKEGFREVMREMLAVLGDALWSAKNED